MAAPQKPFPRPKSTGAGEKVHLRFEFYRDMFRHLATSMPILGIALLISVSLNVILATRKPVERYFTVDAAGRIIKVPALTEPYVTDSYISSWVSEKVSRAYSMDPDNYKREVSDLAPWFTPDGFDQYKGSLVSAGIIDFMTRNLLISSGVPTNAAVVVHRDIDKATGTFYWKVQVPMLVTYRSSNKIATKKRVVEVTVVRRLTIECPDGIGISQFVASDA